MDRLLRRAVNYSDPSLLIKYFLVLATIADYIMYVPDCLDGPPTTEAIGLVHTTRDLFSRMSPTILYTALCFLSMVAYVFG